MKIIINIIFYILGIILPITIILVALIKKATNKKKNILKKTILALLIFLTVYTIKFGFNKIIDTTENKLDNKPANSQLENTSNETKATIEVNSKEENITTTTTTTAPPITNNNNSNNNNNNSIKNTDNTSNLKIIDGILIVNKTYPLPADYVPTNTYKSAEGLEYCSTCIDKEAYEQYKIMKADATSLGLNIWIQSGYRSYSLQEKLYNKYVNRDGKLAADTYSARPGYSEHQTGLAFDLNSISDDFQYTEEGKWVHNNAYKYGFILRYPKGKEDITGYKYESWHLRYVGVDLATKLYNNGDWITLEEHFNLTSKYEN